MLMQYLEDGIESSIFEFDGKRLERLSIENEKMAKEIVDSAVEESFIVDTIDVKGRVAKTPPPFMDIYPSADGII